MAIQIRRGSNATWEANKSNILVGEPAVATDSKRAFIGTASGAYMELANIEAIAPAYDPGNSYMVDDYVSYQGKLYVCTVPTSGAWNASCWQVTSIGQALAENAYSNFETQTVSGDIVSFPNGASGIPVKDLKADVVAVQNLNGYDHPWVGGAGKNLFDELYPSISESLIYKSIYVGDGTFTMSTTTPQVQGAADLFFLTGQTTSGAATSTNGVWNGQNRTIQSTNGYVTIAYRVTGGDMAYSPANYKTQIEKGSSATAYEPYTNICPISGWDEVNVVVDPKYGGFINWNQIANYSTVTSAGIEKSVDSNGVMSLSGTANGNVNILEKIEHISGHKYIFLFEVVENPNNVSFTIGMSQGSPWINNITDSRYIIYTSIYGSYFGLYNVTSKNLTGLKLRVMISDLTQIFGEGNEPTTVDEFKTLFPNDYYAYNTGEETCVSALNGESYGIYTIDLDGTRYGGTFDVTTGVLTLTHGYINATSVASAGASSTASYFGQVIASGAKPTANSVVANIISSQLTANTANNVIGVESNGICVNNNGAINIKIVGMTSKSAYNTYLTSNPLQIVYELATPQTVQLTPTQVRTVLGQNNIWADSGEVEVTYRISNVQ